MGEMGAPTFMKRVVPSALGEGLPSPLLPSPGQELSPVTDALSATTSALGRARVLLVLRLVREARVELTAAPGDAILKLSNGRCAAS